MDLLVLSDEYATLKYSDKKILPALLEKAHGEGGRQER